MRVYTVVVDVLERILERSKTVPKTKTLYTAKSGVQTPITVQIVKTDIKTMLRYATNDKQERNVWCTHETSCAKYGCRPCCPPKCTLLTDMKPRRNFYIICVTADMEQYLKVHPSIATAKSWKFLALKNAHSLTRNVQNKISDSFAGQIFRVGGCLGCQYIKTGNCKRFAPSLEATGVNVVKLAKKVLDVGISWMKDGILMSEISAIGGIYTDEDITPAQFKAVIAQVVNSPV